MQEQRINNTSEAETNENSYCQSFSHILENIYKQTSKVETKVAGGILLCTLAYIVYHSGGNEKVVEDILMSYWPLILMAGYGLTVSVNDLTYVMKELINKFTLPDHTLNTKKLVGHGTRFFYGSALVGFQSLVANAINASPARYLTGFSGLFSLYAATDWIANTIAENIPNPPDQEQQSHSHTI